MSFTNSFAFQRINHNFLLNILWINKSIHATLKLTYWFLGAGHYPGADNSSVVGTPHRQSTSSMGIADHLHWVNQGKRSSKCYIYISVCVCVLWLIILLQLKQNPRYSFWSRPFTHCAPEIEKLFESVSRSCGGPKAIDDSIVAGGLTDGSHWKLNHSLILALVFFREPNLFVDISCCVIITSPYSLINLLLQLYLLNSHFWQMYDVSINLYPIAL